MITANLVRARQEEYTKNQNQLDESSFWKELEALIQEAFEKQNNYVLYYSVYAFSDYKKDKLSPIEERIVYILNNAGFQTKEIISDSWGEYKRSLRISW